jgi:bacterioferritin-associated ferredoxin
MYVCICNPFRDKDVTKHLDATNKKVRVGDVYKRCSGGENPQCCRCIQTLKDMIYSHPVQKDIRSTELVDA